MTDNSSGTQCGTRLDTLGGHGMLLSEDSQQVVKDTLSTEARFYEEVNKAGPQGPLGRIQPWLPRYFGKLSPKASNAPLDGLVCGAPTDMPVTNQRTTIALENLLLPFDPSSRTCFDIKLGRIMYDSSADADKIAKMRAQVEKSTSAVSTPRGKVSPDRHYGYSLRRSPEEPDIGDDTFQEAMAKLFPAPGDAELPLVSADDPGAPSQIATLTHIGSTISRINDAVARLRSDVQSTPWRFIGSSVSVAYESFSAASAHSGVTRRDDSMSEPSHVHLLDFARGEPLQCGEHDRDVADGLQSVSALLLHRHAQLASRCSALTGGS